MATAVIIKHPNSGMIKIGYYGFSWTYLFFGWFVPLFRGELGVAALHMLFFNYHTGTMAGDCGFFIQQTIYDAYVYGWMGFSRLRR